MNPEDAQEPQPTSSQDETGLTIGQLAQRTGVAPATLRMWEARHGFPRARRLPSGHRRYDHDTVEQVRQVMRRREAGVRLESAIEGVDSGPEVPAPSVYAVLHHRHPHLMPHRLRKSTLLALTWALEDEFCARAQRPWLFGAFQEERYYRQAERRWADLARTARRAWVLADFDQDAEPAPPRPVEVSIPGTAPMHREWSMVCMAPDYPAALAAWELPGQDHVKDGDRRFESLWTLEPGAVRDAATVCARVVGDLGHDTRELQDDLARTVPPASPELRRATVLFNRVVSYVDRVR